MKKYNESLLDATKKLSQETLDKSAQTVSKLTHPSDKVSKIGSTVGKSIGVGLVTVGAIAAITGSLWGVVSGLAGILTIASNNIKGKKDKHSL